MDRLSCILSLTGLCVALSGHAQAPLIDAGIVDGYSVGIPHSARATAAGIVDGYSVDIPRSARTTAAGIVDGYSVGIPHSAHTTAAGVVDGYSVGIPHSVHPTAGNPLAAPHRIQHVVKRFGSSRSAFRLPKLHFPYRVSGAYEFGWLQPRFTENVSVVVSETSGDQAYAFEHPFQPTPRVWVGIENAKRAGLRARYWNLSTKAPTQVTFALAGATPVSLTLEGGGGNLSRTAVANTGDAMTSKHRIRMRTIDFEGTQRLQFERTEMLASFGLRYARMEQRAHAVATDGGGALTELVCQDLGFDGFGPTLSFEVVRCLRSGPVLGRLSFYATGRGSIVFGTLEQQIVLVTAGGATVAEDQYEHESVLPIAELSGGLQLAVRPFGPGLWAVRAGYHAESWFNAGGPVETQSNIGLHGMLLSIEAAW
jgi:hypothetical protein